MLDGKKVYQFTEILKMDLNKEFVKPQEWTLQIRAHSHT